MKKLAFFLAMVAFTAPAFAQSSSYQKFRDKFEYCDQSYSFKTNGLLVRTVLKFAGEDEAKRALRNIDRVRVTAVPKSAFAKEEVTVSGFKKVIASDNFAEVLSVREDGSDVTVYERTSKDRNRYLVLVEDSGTVVLLEVTGYIDTDYLKTMFFAHDQKS